MKVSSQFTSQEQSHHRCSFRIFDDILLKLSIISKCTITRLHPPPLPQIVPLESVCFFPYNQDRICTNFHEKSMLVLSLSQSNIRLMVD